MKLTIYLFAIAVMLLSTSVVSAAANLAINSFSCTPSEVAVNDVFSCTARIYNSGDASGSVSELRLYPDSNDWLEPSNYLATSGTSVGTGQSTDVTFTGLRATKTGLNGFSRITLDNVDDTYVSSGSVEDTNVISVAVTTTNSRSSAPTGDTFTVTPEVTAGGSIDVTLTLNLDSGGCSIGTQSSEKSTTGLTNQQKWTPTAWTITQGDSGNCVYTLSAAATGASGVASKTSSASSSVTCSNCTSASSSSSSSSSGGGGSGSGGGGTGARELNESISYDLGSGESATFKFGGVSHTLIVSNVTDVQAAITIKSKEKTFIMRVGEEKKRGIIIALVALIMIIAGIIIFIFYTKRRVNEKIFRKSVYVKN